MGKILGLYTLPLAGKKSLTSFEEVFFSYVLKEKMHFLYILYGRKKEFIPLFLWYRY
ncbi:hypothetical protein [Methanomethylovorans sp. PtaU1.Bin093]|uniref:hypothetical protein n=1 Tax=Methanomethylovorans sp. PtaU1.Bin093 TaxID=1811679 RepID=UPI0025CD66F2|nr:hypothetical protein [Methanomethylovorans sp. PtaU1.Bin093]